MKLQDNLYRIISQTDSSAQVELLADCIIYKAHFPGRPVTPGVCIIGMAGELLEILTGMRLSLAEVVNAKFLAVINPHEMPVITYTFSKLVADDAAATLKVTAAVTAGDTVCSKLSLLYNVK